MYCVATYIYATDGTPYVMVFFANELRRRSSFVRDLQNQIIQEIVDYSTEVYRTLTLKCAKRWAMKSKRITSFIYKSSHWAEKTVECVKVLHKYGRVEYTVHIVELELLLSRMGFYICTVS